MYIIEVKLSCFLLSAYKSKSVERYVYAFFLKLLGYDGFKYIWINLIQAVVWSFDREYFDQLVSVY